jgi:hypothetical protein
MKIPLTTSSSITADISVALEMVAVRRDIRRRRGLIFLTVFAAVAGAALNWNWLVAAGLALALLGALPCLLVGRPT